MFLILSKSSLAVLIKLFFKKKSVPSNPARVSKYVCDSADLPSHSQLIPRVIERKSILIGWNKRCKALGKVRAGSRGSGVEIGGGRRGVEVG